MYLRIRARRAKPLEGVLLTTVNRKEIVVGPEEATFWMDRWGNWCNRHGRFEHKKIIAYFHSAIRRDESGYFVSQVNGEVLEKVYFHYEDTALFVFDVTMAQSLRLTLNTGRRLVLDPASLFIRGDALYLQEGTERIKFNQTSMLKMSRYFDYQGSSCFFCYQEKRFPVPVEGDAAVCEKADKRQDRSGGSVPLPADKAGTNP
jgi:hypothetical protein